MITTVSSMLAARQPPSHGGNVGSSPAGITGEMMFMALTGRTSERRGSVRCLTSHTSGTLPFRLPRPEEG